VLPITIVFLVGAAALAGAAFELATGIRFVTVAPSWLLKPMTIPDLAGAAGASGAFLESPVCPTTMLSRTSGTGAKAAEVAPTTIFLGGGGSGSPEKNVAPSCFVMGFGLRWWLVEVRLDTV